MPISKAVRPGRARLHIFASIIAALVLAGCGDKTIDHNDVDQPLDGSAQRQQKPTMPPGHPPLPGPQQVDMAQQQLPASSMSESGNPKWSVPQGWQEGQTNAIRRATFLIPGDDGQAEVSVTAFPGDVGGMLPNVNRWRAQDGLLPITADQLEDNVKKFTVDGHDGYVAQIVGKQKETVAVAAPDGKGSTWFFKLSGPSKTVEGAQTAFLAFVQSVDFPD